MSLDFQQVREQVSRLGENARQREQRLQFLREKAFQILQSNAGQIESLRQKVDRVIHLEDPSLRCGKPVSERLDETFPPPALPQHATILAADGSQITPDRHAPVDFCLVNVGAIRMSLGLPEPPATIIRSRLLYDEELNSEFGQMSEARLALMRDISERTMLAELAVNARPPVITFTDGQMELWGSRPQDSAEASQFQKSQAEYVQVLTQLCASNVTTAGYVDKPGSDLVVRLLEVAMTPEDELKNLRKNRPLRGVRDLDLFTGRLQPGDRSAVFEIQSVSSEVYKDQLAIHFFYLNIGRPNHPYLARIETPAWVAGNPQMLNDLHAVLVDQCRMMGNKPYPYLLHRAHETALVTLQDKEQVTQMILIELRNRGITVGEASNKQTAKDLSGRRSYS
ncbi:MAG: DNA double-strand break repair nuclease NurA [Omnitrophica WOR_2 bacterium]